MSLGEAARAGLGAGLGAMWAGDSIAPLPGAWSRGTAMGSGWAGPSGPIDSRSNDSKASQNPPPPWLCVVYSLYAPLVIEEIPHLVSNSHMSVS